EQVPDASKMSRYVGNSYLSDCVYDEVGNVIATHEHADEFKGSMGCDVVLRARRAAPRRHDQPKQGRDVLAGAAHDPAMKPTAHGTLPWLIFFSLDLMPFCSENQPCTICLQNQF